MSTKSAIQECTFDRGLIAPKVGVWHPPSQVTSADLQALAQEAAAAGYSVLYVRSPAAIAALAPHFQGQLVSFQGDRDSVLATLNQFAPKYPTRPLVEADWDAVSDLYWHASPTRFSRDPRIGVERAHRHKLACLRAYWTRSPEYFRVALDPGQRIVGVQGCLPQAEQLDLYESVIAPGSRNGFALAALLRANLLRGRDQHPSLRQLATRIYHDNAVASRYYRELGMTPSGVEFFYHWWIDSGSKP